MARSVSSSSRKEVITDVVTTTLQTTTFRLVLAHSNAFPSPISTGLVEWVKLATNDSIVDGVRSRFFTRILRSTFCCLSSRL
jgi:hypothetical protein